MPPIVNVSVANMLQGTKPEDISDHFKALLGESCMPTVGPIVAYEKRREGKRSQLRLSATVAFHGSGDWRNKLHKSKLCPSIKEVGYTKITVESTFAGVTYLKEIPQHDFDVFFVHGIGGHAFNTWTFRRKNNPIMWPRDLLPERLRKRNLNGRYSTIGYEARPFKEATITSAAESLLKSLDEGRMKGDKRPIFFVCHGSGGLVVCRALGLVLWKTKREHEIFRQKLTTTGNDSEAKCLVKGIAFFGTPFQGSRLADFVYYAVSLQKALGGRKPLVEELKSNTEELNDIVGVFKQLTNKHDIDIKVYYEKEPLPILGFSFWVTRPVSAVGFFSRFDPTGLNANHRTMVKFEDAGDANYRLVEAQLVDLIKTALDREKRNLTTSPIKESLEDDTLSVSASFSTLNDIGADIQLEEALQTGNGKTEGAPPPSPRIEEPSRFHFIHSRSPKTIPLTPIVTYDMQENTVVCKSDPNTPIDMAPAKDAGGPLPLRDYNTVFILDDTCSMAIEDTQVSGTPMSRWECLLSSIQCFEDVIAKMDRDGVSVRFLINREKDMSHVRDGRQLLQNLHQIKLYHKRFRKSNASKESCLNAVLSSVISDYMFRLRRRNYDIEDKKPPEDLKKLKLIVITAGDLDEYEEVERTLVTTARDLLAADAPSDQVGVQFVHVGKDVKAASWLRTLDNHLKQMYGVRDIDDTRTFDAGANYDDFTLQKKIRQILLGGVKRDIDNEDDDK